MQQALAESGKLKLIFWQDLALPDPDQTSKMFYRYAHQVRTLELQMLLVRNQKLYLKP